MNKLSLFFAGMMLSILSFGQAEHEVCISPISGTFCSGDSSIFTPQHLTINVGDSIQFTCESMFSPQGYVGTTHDIKFNGGSPMDVLLPVSTNVFNLITTVKTPAFVTPGIYTMECVESIHCSFAFALENWPCNGYTVTVLGPTATEPNNFKSNINIYPNPTSGLLSIALEEGSATSVTLRNSLGQLLLADKTLSTNQVALDLSSYPTGIYFLQLEVDGQVVTKKVVKE